ncbi:DUF3953 domain-containing protein [Paenisporosarcina sp. NPDC076898]|uniref:DUF3953 domain-containing protein n=1 Tax=Paenisporosarcina sp. NPDC076898 TaxID=3390603 RepID=UPI003D062B8C
MHLLIISRFIFSILVLTLSIYSLITKNFELLPVIMLFLGANMMVVGIEGFQKKPKAAWGFLSIIVSFFVFFVALQGFLIK